MRTLTIYIAALAILFAAASCSVETTDLAPAAGKIALKVLSSDPDTRADESNQLANEKAIDHIDYFFFKDAEGSTLLKHLRTTDNPVTIDVTDDAYTVLKNTSYVYAIANYPDDISANSTLSSLLALEVSTDLTAAQTTFIMDSWHGREETTTDGGTTYTDTFNPSDYLVELTPSEDNQEASYEINLARVASKIVIDMTIKSSVTDNKGIIWTPIPAGLNVTFNHALGKMILAGEPLSATENSSSLLDYGSNLVPSPAANTLSYETTPVYTYPVSFSTSDKEAPYFKIIMAWDSEEKGANTFYYKLPIPSKTTLDRNCCYMITLNLGVLGGTSDDYVLVEDYYYYKTDWFNPDFVSGEVIYSARFLDIAQDEYYLYGANTITIPVTSSHALQAVVTSARKFDLNSHSYVNYTGAYNVSTSGKDKVILSHTLNTSFTSSMDVSPIIFTVRVTHNPADGLDEVFTVTQYPPVYITEKPQRDGTSAKVWVNGQGSPASTSGAVAVYASSGNQIGTLAGYNVIVNGGQNNNPRQYIFKVSAFPADQNTTVRVDGTNTTVNYSIEDVRQSNPQNLTSLNWNSVGHPTHVHMTKTDRTWAVSPHFLMSSSLGRTSAISTYEEARQRCASYQENGYPAGRWRLPTAGELVFVEMVSNRGLIPSLLNGEQWIADGRVFHVDENPSYQLGIYSSVVPEPNGTIAGAGARCVYDLWYWGEDQVGTNDSSWLGWWDSKYNNGSAIEF